MKHVPRQRGLWTPTPGVSTAIFRDKLRGIQTKKRNGGHVDLFLLYNIKSEQCPQTSGGPRVLNRIRSLSRTLPPPLVHWGEPFHCPLEPVRESSKYGVWIWAYSFKLLAGEQDATAEAILRNVTMACICFVELDETAHLSFGIRSIC
jgi:hypothetical protein